MTGTFEGTEALGPTEFIVVGFAGNRFTGDIAPALAELVDSGLIRMIDLAVVSKDADGAVTILEMQELSPEVADRLRQARRPGPRPPLRGRPRRDRRGPADPVDRGRAARRACLGDALRRRRPRRRGELILAERIPHAVIAEARATLLAAAEYR